MSKNENRNANVNNSNVEITPNSATTATPNLSNYKQRLAEIAKKIAPYNQDYGYIISNLFETLKNQLENLFEIAEKFDNEDDKMEMLRLLWQIDTLIDIICEKSNTNELFFELDELNYYLKELLTNPENK